MRTPPLALLFLLACAPATSAADPPNPDPRRIAIQASAAEAPLQWSETLEAMAKRAPLEVTLWYPFGSAKLRAAPAKEGYRVDVDTEVEGDHRRTTCTLTGAAAWGWDFVRAGADRRQGPPREPPPAFAARCTR